MEQHFQLVNKMEELNRLTPWLEDLGEEWSIPMPQLLSINVVLEEALSNVIFYGFKDTEEHHIDIHFTLEGSTLSILIVDDGLEFDPTLKSDPDLSLSVEDIPIGGLGIYMIKKIMNTVEYHRENQKNYLLLKKTIES